MIEFMVFAVIALLLVVMWCLCKVSDDSDVLDPRRWTQSTQPWNMDRDDLDDRRWR